MGDLQGLTSDQWQAVGAVVGAATGIAALALSALALWFAQAGNRAAALVLTWHDDSRLVLENRGPAAARDVHLEVTSNTQRERQKNEPTQPAHLHYEVRQDVARLPVGFTYEDRVLRALGDPPDSFRAELSWRDDRLRRQRLTMVLYQQQRPRSSEPILTDRQVAKLAEQLGGGIGDAVKDHLDGVARRVAQRLPRGGPRL